MMLKHAFFYSCLIAGVLWFGAGCATSEVAATPAPVVQRIADVPIIQTVDAENGVYRSEQPSQKEFLLLEQAGLKSVLNLRNYHSDKSKIKGTSLAKYRLKTNAGSFSEEDIYDALKVLRDAPRPILIHCWHGADRTGTVVAAYRIAFQNWDVEKAVEEMMLPEYGHHANVYPNLPKLLRSVNWPDMRKRLELQD